MLGSLIHPTPSDTPPSRNAPTTGPLRTTSHSFPAYSPTVSSRPSRPTMRAILRRGRRRSPGGTLTATGTASRRACCSSTFTLPEWATECTPCSTTCRRPLIGRRVANVIRRNRLTRRLAFCWTRGGCCHRISPGEFSSTGHVLR